MHKINQSISQIIGVLGRSMNQIHATVLIKKITRKHCPWNNCLYLKCSSKKSNLTLTS
jgi:hypothetical protein